MLSITRRVRPSGSALVSRSTRARPALERQWSNRTNRSSVRGPCRHGRNDTARRTRGRSIWRFEPIDAATDDLGAKILESHSGRGGSRIRERARPIRPRGGALTRTLQPASHIFVHRGCPAVQRSSDAKGAVRQHGDQPPLGADTWIHVQIMRHLDRRPQVYAACARGTPTARRRRPTRRCGTIPDLDLMTVDFGPELDGPLDAASQLVGLRPDPARAPAGLFAWPARPAPPHRRHPHERPPPRRLRLRPARPAHRATVHHPRPRRVQPDLDGPAAALVARATPTPWSPSREFVADSLVDGGIRPDAGPRRAQRHRRRPPGSPDAGATTRDASSASAPTTPVLVTVCRLFPEKGPAELIEALARVRAEVARRRCSSSSAADVTPATTATSSRALVAELGLDDRVRFLGRRPRRRGPDWPPPTSSPCRRTRSRSASCSSRRWRWGGPSSPSTTAARGGRRARPQRPAVDAAATSTRSPPTSSTLLARSALRRAGWARTVGATPASASRSQRMAADVGARLRADSVDAPTHRSADGNDGRIEACGVLDGTGRRRVPAGARRRRLRRHPRRRVARTGSRRAERRRCCDEFDRAAAAGELFEGGGLAVSGHLNCFPGEQSRFVCDEIADHGIVDLVRAVRPDIVDSVRATLNFNLPGSVAAALPHGRAVH